MERLEGVREQLLEFYLQFRQNGGVLDPNQSYAVSAIHSVAEIIDDILSDFDVHDTDLAEMIGEDFFMLNFAPPNLVIRELDVNSVDLRRRYRRSRRKGRGKENRRPRRH